MMSIAGLSRRALRARFLESRASAFVDSRPVPFESLSVRAMNFGQHWRTPDVPLISYSLELPGGARACVLQCLGVQAADGVHDVRGLARGRAAARFEPRRACADVAARAAARVVHDAHVGNVRPTGNGAAVLRELFGHRRTRARIDARDHGQARPDAVPEGEASLFAQSELRLFLTRFYFLAPADFGVLGLADVGRVFVDGEESDRWHAAGGGGVWASFLDRAYMVRLSVAASSERTALYLGIGRGF